MMADEGRSDRPAKRAATFARSPESLEGECERLKEGGGSEGRVSGVRRQDTVGLGEMKAK